MKENYSKIDLVFKKLTILENQIAKTETILTNLDYINNRVEKVKG